MNIEMVTAESCKGRGSRTLNAVDHVAQCKEGDSGTLNAVDHAAQCKGVGSRTL